MGKYKFGEKILVGHLGADLERIFIAQNGSVVYAVDRSREDDFSNGVSFGVIAWEFHKPIPKVKYRTYTREECYNLVGRRVKHKSGHIELINRISAPTEELMVSIGNEYLHAEDLLDVIQIETEQFSGDWIPFGVRVSE